MRQSVMLTGLSLSTFDEALDSVYAIQDMFRQHMINETMEDWAPSIFHEHSSIDVSNRYFTPHQNAMLDCQISFDPAVDPDNILSAAMADGKFVHVEDNQVEYYEACKDNRGTKWVLFFFIFIFFGYANETDDRHEEISPNAIRVGDIVEAQISFEGVQLKGNRSKMIVVLRALTLLDKEPLEVSQKNEVKRTN